MKILLITYFLTLSCFASIAPSKLPLGVVMGSQVYFWAFSSLDLTSQEKLRSLVPKGKENLITDPRLKKQILKQYDVSDPVTVIDLKSGKTSNHNIKSVRFNRNGGGDCLYSYNGFNEYISIQLDSRIKVPEWGLALPLSAKILAVSLDEKKKIADYLKADEEVKKSAFFLDSMQALMVEALELDGNKIFISDYPINSSGGIEILLKFKNERLENLGLLHLPPCGS